MFGLYSFFDECPEIINPSAQLISLTKTSFPALPSTYLEVRHSLVFELLEQLDIEAPEFDNQYNQIIAGTIIHALSYETSYYYDSEGPLYNLYPLKMKELFELCDITTDSIDFKVLIIKLGEKAQKEVIPFDEKIIERYFSIVRNHGPLKDILQQRFSELTNTNTWCQLF